MKRRDRYLTTREVGERLGFKSRTVSRWCREGKLAGARKIGRVWRVPETTAMWEGKRGSD